MKNEKTLLGGIKGREVMALRRLDAINKYNKNPKKCKGCENNIAYEFRKNIFCTKKCACSFNNNLKQYSGVKSIKIQDKTDYYESKILIDTIRDLLGLDPIYFTSSKEIWNEKPKVKKNVQSVSVQNQM